MNFGVAAAAFHAVANELGLRRLREERDVLVFQREDGWQLMIEARHSTVADVLVKAPPEPDGKINSYQLWLLRQALLGLCELPDPVTEAQLADFLRDNADTILDARQPYRARYQHTNACVNALPL